MRDSLLEIVSGVAGPTDRVLVPDEAAPAGLALGEAIGLAWAQQQAGGGEDVYALLSAAGLAASASGDLATYAVRQRLGNLKIVVHADEPDRRAEDRLDELAGRGWLTYTAGGHNRDAIVAALRRAPATRPSLLYCIGMRPAAAVRRPAAPPPRHAVAATRAPLEVTTQGAVGEIGAFALGVAQHGAYLPTCTLPLAEAYALTPVLRRATRMRLPVVFRLTQAGDEPADALPALELIAGIEILSCAGGSQVRVAQGR